MRNLLEEYVKDVLEVDTQLYLPLKILLSLLESLMEVYETVEEDAIRRLEGQRRQIQDVIKRLARASFSTWTMFITTHDLLECILLQKSSQRATELLLGFKTCIKSI